MKNLFLKNNLVSFLFFILSSFLSGLVLFFIFGIPINNNIWFCLYLSGLNIFSMIFCFMLGNIFLADTKSKAKNILSVVIPCIISAGLFLLLFILDPYDEYNAFSDAGTGILHVTEDIFIHSVAAPHLFIRGLGGLNTTYETFFYKIIVDFIMIGAGFVFKTRKEKKAVNNSFKSHEAL